MKKVKRVFVEMEMHYDVDATTEEIDLDVNKVWDYFPDKMRTVIVNEPKIITECE